MSQKPEKIIISPAPTEIPSVDLDYLIGEPELQQTDPEEDAFYNELYEDRQFGEDLRPDSCELEEVYVAYTQDKIAFMTEQTKRIAASTQAILDSERYKNGWNGVPF